MKRGRPSKEDVSAGFRALQESPHAFLLYNTELLQRSYLPFLIAYTPEDKADLISHIIPIFGLEEAKETGLIAGYEILWKNKNSFPDTPVKVTLFPPSRADHKMGHGWERFVPRTFLREMRKYLKRYDSIESGNNLPD